jgi:hypothetical protein
MAKAPSISIPPIAPGQRYGRLVAVELHGVARYGRGTKAQWRFRCDCGNEKIIIAASVRRGLTKSCGCLNLELATKRLQGRPQTGRDSPRYRHGYSRTRIYRIWSGILSRCTNPNEPGYKHYGGRGITVCDRWRNSFEAFLADMGECPSPDLSIDRIDNEKGYEPGNCRWATRKEQRANRRDSCSA